MLSGDLAVEEAVLGVHKPRILQFATHGFSLNGPSADSRKWDNPLLRSGMVLAGVNKWSKEHAVYYRLGKEIFTEGQARSRGLSEQQLSVDRVEVADGILTAYEVTGMNLQGTELVNLTACQTGLGEVTPDGVVGLRQSFLLAGARSLTMSMWEVPAEETGRQISNFYERWLGEGKETRKMTRYQAFRSAQLAALARVRQRGGGHPFYWAGLIYVGDPGDLSSSMTRREK
jgi:CHAT domain-containing protein